MRKIIAMLLCVSFVSCERLYAPNENRHDTQNLLKQGAYPNPDSTFYVENDTHVNIGSVTIQLIDSSNAIINVSDSGLFSAHVVTSTASCQIHGQSLGYATPSWISIDAHTQIHATWTANIVIVDKNEEN